MKRINISLDDFKLRLPVVARFQTIRTSPTYTASRPTGARVAVGGRQGQGEERGGDKERSSSEYRGQRTLENGHLNRTYSQLPRRSISVQRESRHELDLHRAEIVIHLEAVQSILSCALLIRPRETATCWLLLVYQCRQDSVQATNPKWFLPFHRHETAGPTNR